MWTCRSRQRIPCNLTRSTLLPYVLRQGVLCPSSGMPLVRATETFAGSRCLGLTGPSISARIKLVRSVVRIRRYYLTSEYGLLNSLTTFPLVEVLVGLFLVLRLSS